MKKILVTGGAGFIGSEFVRQSVGNGYRVSVADSLTYAGDLKRLDEVARDISFYKVNITNRAKMEAVLKKVRPDVIVHFAAQTHVDRSIQNVAPFIETNIQGTQTLIDLSLKLSIKKFLHISTDEVYGESRKGYFTEESPVRPKNPYSATKAAAEFLVRAAVKTHGLSAIIIRPANNYGPWQYPEKLIPVVILKALRDQKVPVYGQGAQIREWLFVRDCAAAIEVILNKGIEGEVYNVGTSFEQTNLKTVKTILRLLKKPESLIEFVKDRPGHDFRYSVDYSKIQALGWTPSTGFAAGLKETLEWYTRHLKWTAQKADQLEKCDKPGFCGSKIRPNGRPAKSR